MSEEKIVRPLLVLSDELNRILDNKLFPSFCDPVQSDMCFQLKVSIDMMRTIFGDAVEECYSLKSGRTHPVACGTPHCKNWYSDATCSSLIAQIRYHLGPKDIYVNAFDNYEHVFQENWKKAEPPQLVWEEKE